jgi:hypothetical protein
MANTNHRRLGLCYRLTYHSQLAYNHLMNLDLELERITNPLRLAKGSHQRGSGKGCAMNVISYTNGDVEITDYPQCSARPLARLVQRLNDIFAGPDGYLSPEDSVTVLDLGWLTVGTANVPPEVVWRWLADLMTHEHVVGNAEPKMVKAIHRVAKLCHRQADGFPVSVTQWRKVWPTGKPEISTSPAFSAAASAFGYGVGGGFNDAGPGAVAAAAVAAAGAVDAQVAFTRWAITRWRELAGLDQQVDVAEVEVDYIRELVGV